jgi:hypothetical protein
MDFDALETIAEVATAFAGFTGLITFFQRRDRDSWRAVDRTRFWFMIELSLGVLFLSFVPRLLSAFSGDGAVPWRFACGVVALSTAVQAASMGVRVVRLTEAERGPRTRFTVPLVSTGFLASTTFLALSVLGIGVAPGLGPYLVGLLWLLAAATYQFIRIVAAGEPPIAPISPDT